MDDGSQKTLLAEKIYEDLSAFILTKGLRPGDRLTIDDLVRKFGVSQTPVRQALSRLQSDGLVVNKPNSGFRVSDVPSKDVLLDALDARAMIETELAYRAATRCDDKTLLTLSDCLKEQQGLDTEDDHAFFSLVQSDATFHRTIGQAAGNPVALEILERLHRRTTVFRLKFAPSMPHEVVVEHKKIFEGLQARDAVAASDAMRAHLQASKKRVETAK